MSSLWKGVFLDLKKHYLGTGTVANHIELRGKPTLLDDDEREEYDVEDTGDDDDPEQIQVIGEGDLAYRVVIGFIGDSTDYEFVMMFSPPGGLSFDPTEQEIKNEVGHYLEDKAKR